MKKILSALLLFSIAAGGTESFAYGDTEPLGTAPAAAPKKNPAITAAADFVQRHNIYAAISRYRRSKRMEFIAEHHVQLVAAASGLVAAGLPDAGADAATLRDFVHLFHVASANLKLSGADATLAAALAKKYFPGFWIEKYAAAADFASAAQVDATGATDDQVRLGSGRVGKRDIGNQVLAIRKARAEATLAADIGTGRNDADYNTFFDARVATLSNTEAVTALKTEISALARKKKTEARDARLLSLLTTYDVLRRLE
jgi:hypothetical protein